MNIAMTLFLHVAFLFLAVGEVSCSMNESFFWMKRQEIEMVKPTWTEIHTETAPLPRDDMAMAYDSKRKKLVLFGGIERHYPTNTLYNDTWEFYDDQWHEVVTAHAPSARGGSRMVYCRSWDRMVLFGGSGGGYQNDTWQFVDGDWVKLSPPASPSARSSHGMVFDESVDRIVVFGGPGPSGFNFDTWTFDGTTWEKAQTIGPDGAQESAMVYDSKAGRTLIFGGFYHIYTPNNELWEFDGRIWKLIDTPTKVPPRLCPSYCFDRFRGKMILFGGEKPTSPFITYRETWEFDGRDWQLIDTIGNPSAREDADMCYLDHEYRSILFGGRGGTYLNDTWAYSAVVVSTSAPTLSHFAVLVTLVFISSLLVFTCRRKLRNTTPASSGNS